MKEIFKRDLIMGALAVFAMVNMLLLTWILAFVSIPELNRDIFNMVAGAGVVANLGLVMNFFFGSSKGSRIKDEESV